ncbi:LptF/LptG family permease [uncultured Victivallis sp.]|uniref:LptF/LptG family permease n=1 Tax=uncultured Victivallis sp. TaxID=354118 RepID=UPI0025D79342|nr:LptF/LptG family permease [uncultured Victivallis sp.]
MKTLNWYVTRGFLLAFSMAIAILTFGMTGANLVKVLDYVSQGISFWTFLEFTLYILPIILTFTVPWAVMVAVMLVFGRMSADCEITAMRACGISIMQIVSPILIITFFLTLFCLYLQVEIGPPLLGKSRSLMQTAAINQPLAIFEPGKPIEYENTIIYIDDKEGENGIKGVQIYTLSDPQTVAQDISAARGELSVDKEKQLLIVHLYDCLVVDKKSTAGGADKAGGGVPTRFYTQELEFSFNYGRQANAQRISVRPKYMTLADLMGRIRLTKELNRDTTELEVELNQRIAFALSPIAFLLLGLPLAIRTSRRETSVGLFLSVILAGLFFLSIILCESLSSFPKLYPQYLLWLPNIVFQILGAVMTYRISQR